MATPLKLVSSMATRTLLADVVARYRERTGREVRVESIGAVHAVERLEAGAAFDGALLASDAIDRLVATGHLLGPRTDVARAGVAVAVKAGAARPDIGSEAAIRQAVLAAPTLGCSTGASGVALRRLFERWGLLPQIQPRLVVPPPGTPVGLLVARGEVALGFQQLSELMFLEGIDIVGPLPDAIRIDTVFSACTTAHTRQAASARAFFDFLNTPRLAAVKLAHGLGPV